MLLPASVLDILDIDHDRIDQAFFDAEFDWEVLSDVQGKIIYISPTCKQFIGYDPDQIYQNPNLLFDIVHPQEQAYIKRHADGKDNQFISSTFETRIVPLPGETINIEHRCIAIHDRQGNYLGRWERNRVLNEQEISSQYNQLPTDIWESLIGKAPDIITLIDPHGKILFTNSVPPRGSVRDSFGKCVYDFIIPEHRSLAYQTIQRVMKTGKPDTYEIASDREGRRFWYMTRVGVIREGERIQYVTLVIRDITDRKEIEGEIQRLNEELEQRVQDRTLELKESLERHRVISELIPDYVYAAQLQADSKICFDWVSGALEQISGYTPAEINQQPQGWLSIVHPDDRQKIREIIFSSSRENKISLEYRFIHKNGKINWIRDLIKRVDSKENSQVVQFWAAAQDITERILAEIALQRHAWRLETNERLNFRLRQVENRLQALEALVDQSQNAFSPDLNCAYLLEDDELHLKVWRGNQPLPPKLLIPQDNTLPSYLMNSPEQVIFLTRVNFRENRACVFCSYLFDSDIQAAAIAPLRTIDNMIGFLLLTYQRLPSFTPDDRQLLGAMAESGGNTLHRIQIMEQLEQHIRSREQELHVLHEVMAATSSTLNLDLVLEQSLESILKATNSPHGMIHLIDPQSQQPSLAVISGIPVSLNDRLNILLANNNYLEMVRRSGTLTHQNPFSHPVHNPEDHLLTYLGVPIRTRGEVLGILSLFRFDHSHFTEQIVNLVQTVADQLGTAVEITRLNKKTQETLIIDERQRLARNMHDSVSQFLYGLVINADVSAKLLARNDLEGLQQTIDETGNTALQALREMRLLLFELKPLALVEEGLIQALNLRLDAVERRAGIETHFEVEGDEYLPSHLESEIYRITTEALNNAIRHAAPSVINIHLRVSPDALLLEIADNGKGFLPEEVSKGGIGLVSMRERARLIGGELCIQSTPGNGSRVILKIEHTAQKDG